MTHTQTPPRIQNQRCIMSMKVARHLLAKGYRLHDVEPARKFDGLVFIFEDSPELYAELKQFDRKEQ